MDIADNREKDIAWWWMKLSYILVCLPVTCIMALQGGSSRFATGICKIYSFDLLFTPIGSFILIACLIALCALYLFERQMILATFSLSLLSCIIISHHESGGNFFRATVLSTIWIAQFIAYLRAYLSQTFDIRYYRVQYAVQMIAASYTLAGIAKLHTSGLSWINAGDTFPIQVIKNYACLYFDTGSITVWQRGMSVAYFLLHHQWIIRGFLSVSLALEVCCLAALADRRLLIAWGIGLLLMHIGIAYIMGIGISIIAKPMVVFFLNPLYVASRLWLDFIKKQSV